MRWISFVLFVFLSGCWADDGAEVCQAERLSWEYESLDIDPEEWHRLYRFEDDVIYVNYPDKGWQPNPVTSAQYALASYNYFLKKGGENHYSAFMKQADYLISKASIQGESAVWAFEFDYAPYDLKAGWISGLAQGQILSVLARRYAENPTPELKILMRQVIRPMMLDRQEGGLLVNTPEGGFWIEEYPSEVPSLVLNGFVFSIIGLGDYLRVVPEDVEVKKFYEQMLGSLKNSLDKYELDGWLAYDRIGMAPVSERYMYIQTRQMTQLHRLTHDEFYSRRCAAWARYEPQQ